MKILQDQTGASMIEYALLLSLMSAAAIVSLQVLGSNVNTAFDISGAAMSDGDRGIAAGTTHAGEGAIAPPHP